LPLDAAEAKPAATPSSQPVDYGPVLADLRARRDGIDRAIAALEALL
jgi:hypothetical protein